METQLSEQSLGTVGGSGRLKSLDILRGFDMFWIVGGEYVVSEIYQLATGSVPGWLNYQLKHVDWNGFAGMDLIFPLFLFIAGVTAPFSFAKAKEKGKPGWKTILHIFKRGLLLVLLGIIYNNGIKFEFATMRLPSVLGRIGIAWMLGALIVYFFKPRWQILWVVALLVGYYCLMKFVPVPEYGAGVWEKSKNLSDYFDVKILGVKHLLCGRPHDPEGIISTIPAIATAILGSLTGEFLRLKKLGGYRKALFIFIAGLALLGLGWLLDPIMPVNKKLWTSSFVLVTAGWSAMLLALFYLIVDVWRFEKWGFFFKVYGMNSITIYLFWRFVDTGNISQIVFKKGFMTAELKTLVPLMIGWLFVFYLYKRKIFLRV